MFTVYLNELLSPFSFSARDRERRGWSADRVAY